MNNDLPEVVADISPEELVDADPEEDEDEDGGADQEPLHRRCCNAKTPQSCTITFALSLSAAQTLSPPPIYSLPIPFIWPKAINVKIHLVCFTLLVYLYKRRSSIETSLILGSVF